MFGQTVMRFKILHLLQMQHKKKVCNIAHITLDIKKIETVLFLYKLNIVKYWRSYDGSQYYFFGKRLLILLIGAAQKD